MFRKECLRLIQDIYSRGRLPILVGGTHYYTQAVLFNEALVGDVEDSVHNDKGSGGEDKSLSERWPILDEPTEVVLQKLREVDPIMANRWHPNESRKIRRSLEVYFQTGQPASEIYAEQKRLTRDAMVDDGAGPGQLRFQTIFLWVHSDRQVLDARLDKRVETMIDQGMLAEAKQMSDYLQAKQSQGVTIDPTKGVWVSIGFKELEPYLSVLSNESLSETELEAVKRTCIESVKTATRQYAKSQIKWIRNKLWTSLAEIGMAHRLFLLDSSNVDDWGKSITEPSENLVQSLLENQPTPDPKSLSELARVTFEAREAQSLNESEPVWKSMTCDMCQKTMVNEEQWKIHLNSQRHRNRLKSAARRAQRDEYLRKKQETENIQNEVD